MHIFRIVFGAKDIRNKVIVSLIFSFILACVCVGITYVVVKKQVTTYFLKIFEVQTYAQLEEHHVSGLNYIGNYFTHISETLEKIANDPQIISMLESGNVRQLQQILDQERTINPHFDRMSVFNMKGVSIMISSDDPVLAKAVNTNFQSREYFQQVIKTKSPYISTVTLSKVNDDLLIVFSVPVFSKSGRLINVINGYAPLKQIKSQLGIKTHISNIASVLIDRSGNLIWSNNRHIRKVQNVKNVDRVIKKSVANQTKVLEEEVNYNGSRVIAIAQPVVIEGHKSKPFYFICYFPKAQFERHVSELRREVDRIFFGIIMVSSGIYIAAWLLNLILIAHYLSRSKKE